MEKVLEQIVSRVPIPNEYAVKTQFVCGTIAIINLLLLGLTASGGIIDELSWIISFLSEAKLGTASWIVLAVLLILVTLATGAVLNTFSRDAIEGWILKKIAGDIELGLFTDSTKWNLDLVNAAREVIDPEKKLTEKGFVEIARAKTGTDFGKNPKADKLTANADLANGLAYLGYVNWTAGLVFIAYNYFSDPKFLDTRLVATLTYVVLSSSMLMVFGHMAHRRAKRALINLYLRAVVYWLSRDKKAE